MKKAKIGKNRRPIAGADSAIDLNPMLDVIFILLIFFILTASFLKESVLPEYSRPDNRSESSEESKVLTIAIDGSNRLSIEGRPVLLTAVRSIAVNALAVNGVDTVFQIQASPEAKVRFYIYVADELRKAEIKNITFDVTES